jgi:hypothetical protein
VSQSFEQLVSPNRSLLASISDTSYYENGTFSFTFATSVWYGYVYKIRSRLLELGHSSRL